MKADALATRLSVLTRALPMRILVVDDDELELALMTDRLVSAGFEVERAANGEEALQLLSKQWMPLVITDWQMPVMDGVTFTEQLRSRGIDDTYVIMLTMRESSMDYERGYYAGVDDYLTKKLPDAELFARIHAGFNTLALRRSLQETRVELQHASRLDAESGACSTTETMTRLQSEIRRAQRYGRLLSLLTVSVHAHESQATAGSDDSVAQPFSIFTDSAPTPVTNSAEVAAISREALHAVVHALQDVVRTHVDWVGRMPTQPGTVSFAVVLPEAGSSDGPTIKERIKRSLEGVRQAGHALTFDFGLAALERGARDGTPVEAAELVAVAEHCRSCSGHAGPAQLNAVQRSVAAGVTIACRHGYAVASHCSFKSDAAPSDERRQPHVARN